MTEEEVFEAVRALVAQGEYLDEIPGVPGTDLSGGGAFRSSKTGLRQRLYTRGSPEYLAARAADLVERLPAPGGRSAGAAVDPPRLRHAGDHVPNGGRR
jgi:hypothetical protein